MVGELSCYIGRNVLLPGMDCANSIQKFFAEMTFQQESPGTGFQGARDLNIARIGREHDESRVRKLASNRDHCINAVHLRHLEVNERDIGIVYTELLDCLPSVGSLS